MTVDDRLLRKCVETWGEQAAIDLAIEEMAELIKSLMKLRRVRSDSLVGRLDDVRDEIADVLMTAQQLRLLFGAVRVDDRIEFKTNRLIERLGEPEKGG
jgi:NTP pyrophosphatase (non-canonical NTP hydrolase)